VKAFYDGSLGARGARLLADYADRPGYRGVSGAEYGFDRDLVAELAAAGFQIGVHAIGDAGNREVLDFFASIPSRVDARHRIEHAQVLHPDDFERFASLGLIASMEPPHCVEDMPWVHDRIGEERARGAYAWRTFRRTGVPLAFNSDLPGSNHDVFYGLHAAITRRSPAGDPPGGWHPEERLSAEEALRGYTTGNAYAAHLEDRSGTIEPGKWADITVLDIDPLRMGEEDPAALLGGRVLMTVVDGRVVFDGR
jgi:predicted amidohydrolase YtcJ